MISKIATKRRHRPSKRKEATRSRNGFDDVLVFHCPLFQDNSTVVEATETFERGKVKQRKRKGMKKEEREKVKQYI